MFHTLQFLRQNWTPKNMPTVAWYDASDTSTITDSLGAVSAWNDIGSTASLHLGQATGLNQPTTNSRTHNGLNVLDCGTAGWMWRASVTLPTSGDLNIFMVAGIDSISSTYDSVFAMDAATNDFQFAALDVLNAQFYGQIARVGTNVVCANGPYAGPSIYSTKWDFTDLGTVSAWIDGTMDGSETYGTKLNAIMNEWSVFTNRAQNNGPDGFMAEVVLVESCTNECRQKIEGYLAHKWNTTLPTGHPYKISPPTI